MIKARAYPWQSSPFCFFNSCIMDELIKLDVYTHDIKCGFSFGMKNADIREGVFGWGRALKSFFIEDDDIVELRTTTYGTAFCDACVDESLLRLIASNAYLFLNCYSCIQYRKAYIKYIFDQKNSHIRSNVPQLI